MINFTIPVTPITKKNHQQIIYTSGRPRVIPSKQYLQYKKDVAFFIPNLALEGPVNVKAVFYMPTRRRVDLTNLLQALLDVLVDYGAIADDNCKIVYSVDGSHVEYDKENPRTEVSIWTI